MGLIRVISSLFLVGVCLSPAVASDENAFSDYFNGAMTVYSKFKEPSIQESENFYAFIKHKWDISNCDIKGVCLDDGVKAAKEYAYRMKVPLDEI